MSQRRGTQHTVAGLEIEHGQALAGIGK
jgi:hypothetical protein